MITLYWWTTIRLQSNLMHVTVKDTNLGDTIRKYIKLYPLGVNTMHEAINFSSHGVAA